MKTKKFLFVFVTLCVWTTASQARPPKLTITAPIILERDSQDMPFSVKPGMSVTCIDGHQLHQRSYISRTNVGRVCVTLSE